ncbi:MAG: alpha/beta hydrolase [Chloroflexi bacterium]|nr:alpha/beta hydrolase [Chloroflexota bacterium]
MPLHPQVVDLMNQGAELNIPAVWEISPEESRRLGHERAKLTEHDFIPVGNVYDRTIPGPAGEIPVRIYEPSATGPHALLMHFHGGGWVVGDLDLADATCRMLCEGINATVVSVDYRMAPETKFPGAPDDCYAATVWAVENANELSIDASKIAIAGTSAGGNLAAAVALMARDKSGPMISHQILFCPVIDYQFERASYNNFAVDYGLTKQAMEWFWEQYIAEGDDPHHPYASPIRADDLSGLAATTIIAAEFDPLVDEAVDYGHALLAAGNDVVTTVYEGMNHGFNGNIGLVDAARTANEEAIARVKASFG